MGEAKTFPLLATGETDIYERTAFNAPKRLSQWRKNQIDALMGRIMSNAISTDLYASPLVFMATLEAGKEAFEVRTLAKSWVLSAGELGEFRDLFASHSHVFVFDEAKSPLKALLVHGIDVARPVCLKTLTTLANLENLPKDPFDKLAALIEHLEAQGAKGLARLECLVLRPFASMEHHGLSINVPQWKSALEVQSSRLKAAREICLDHLAPFSSKDLFGTPLIDLNNPETLKAQLEMVIGQAIPSLAFDSLSEIDHPLAKAYVQYKEASKLLSTYGDRFLEHVNHQTQRVHADFNPLGTSTGRVSCQKPNLQNLPSDPDFVICLKPPQGRVLVHGDFSACELRILAGLAHDSNFLATINSDEDFHSAVASRIFKTKVSKNENASLRERAKAVSFGIIYGMGPQGLARSLRISVFEAEEIMTRYFKTFQGIKAFLEDCVHSAKRLGYAKTHFGRRLMLDSSHDDISRIAKNMPIQGTAAELAKLAMIRIHERLREQCSNSFLVNMIHDELVIECDESLRDNVAQMLKEEMMGAQEALFHNVRPEVDIHFS